MAGQVTCACCGLVFDSGWTDAEAQAEYEQYFPAAAASVGTETVCDHCYRQINAWVDEKGLPR